jgi:hypothetical protein
VGHSPTAAAQAEERVPDWLLGGKVRRRVLEHLAQDRGWAASELADKLGANRTWVFEIYRALRGLGALDSLEEHRYRLADGNAIADALRALVAAATPYRRRKLSRPHGRVRPVKRG